MLLKTKLILQSLHISFCKGHTYLFICDLTPLSVLNEIGHVVSFGFKKSGPFLQSTKK
jgi:hypothetical protein